MEEKKERAAQLLVETEMFIQFNVDLFILFFRFLLLQVCSGCPSGTDVLQLNISFSLSRSLCLSRSTAVSVFAAALCYRGITIETIEPYTNVIVLFKKKMRNAPAIL